MKKRRKLKKKSEKLKKSSKNLKMEKNCEIIYQIILHFHIQCHQCLWEKKMPSKVRNTNTNKQLTRATKPKSQNACARFIVFRQNEKGDCKVEFKNRFEFAVCAECRSRKGSQARSGSGSALDITSLYQFYEKNKLLCCKGWKMHVAMI